MIVGFVVSFIVSIGGELVGYGGEEIVQHYLLRIVLAVQRDTPSLSKLIPFLEAMSRRILLVNAGAHFRFVHRTLQEHFAALG